jgi:divalent metal cation (Fe/Co/Zn/Cd) transporter
VDHRNDIVVNIFGLVMAVVGDKFVWYLDPIGAMCIALLILFSWAANAFDQVWLLVGKSAPRDFLSKLVYMAMTHDERILKVDTVSNITISYSVFLEGSLMGSSVVRTTPVNDILSRLTLSWMRKCH